MYDALAETYGLGPGLVRIIFNRKLLGRDDVLEDLGIQRESAMMIIRTDQKLVYDPASGPPKRWPGLDAVEERAAEDSEATGAAGSDGTAGGEQPVVATIGYGVSAPSVPSAPLAAGAPAASTSAAGPLGGSTAGAGAGSGESAASSSSAPAAEQAEPESVGLVFQMLSGGRVRAEAPYGAPLATVCETHVAPAAGRPPTALRLIHRQKVIDPGLTPRALGLQEGSIIHVVLKAVDLDACRLTWEGLEAHCPVCHTAGARFKARPLCPECMTEEVMLAPGSVSLPRKGSAPQPWTDLTRVRVVCLRGCKGGEPQDASIGFLCSARLPSGERCPSARPPSERGDDSATIRQMQCVYTGGKGRADLQGVLDALCGYAHGAGLEDRVVSDDTKAST